MFVTGQNFIHVGTKMWSGLQRGHLYTQFFDLMLEYIPQATPLRHVIEFFLSPPPFFATNKNKSEGQSDTHYYITKLRLFRNK